MAARKLAQKPTSVAGNQSTPQTEISVDSAAYAIGREAGYRDGLEEGARRERVRWELERIESEKSRPPVEPSYPGPRTLVAEDRATAWVGYAIGAALVVCIATITWRVISG